jgi:hypothetical protein
MSAGDLYETDFYAWTRAQSGALRGLAEAGWKGPIDLERLAEEIADAGSERCNKVLDYLGAAIENLLNLEYSGHRQPRTGWWLALDEARAEIGRRVTPTILEVVKSGLEGTYDHARELAVLGLADQGERMEDLLPLTCPYALDRILDDDWLPANRHGLVDPV